MSSYTGTHGLPPMDGPWGDDLSPEDLLIGFTNIRRLWNAQGSGITWISRCGQGGNTSKNKLQNKLTNASTSTSRTTKKKIQYRESINLYLY